MWATNAIGLLPLLELPAATADDEGTDAAAAAAAAGGAVLRVSAAPGSAFRVAFAFALVGGALM